MERLFYKIKQCKSEEEVRKLIDEAYEEVVENSEKKEQLGFGSLTSLCPSHKGFIHPKTRIKYCSMAVETYGMETKDYIYEFAKMIWMRKDIVSKQSYIWALLEYLDYYFGIPKTNKDTREDIFMYKALRSTETDDEFFAMMEKNTIGDLRGLGVAMCSERGAVAQNLLSMYGFDSYYCYGAFSCGEQNEGHAYNVVYENGSYILLDYSLTVTLRKANGKIKRVPYQEVIPSDKVEDFLNNKVPLSLPDYELIETKDGIKKVPLNTCRNYVIGCDKVELDNGMNL